jgi:hypothetical protein
MALENIRTVSRKHRPLPVSINTVDPGVPGNNFQWFGSNRRRSPTAIGYPQTY